MQPAQLSFCQSGPGLFPCAAPCRTTSSAPSPGCCLATTAAPPAAVASCLATRAPAAASPAASPAAARAVVIAVQAAARRTRRARRTARRTIRARRAADSTRCRPAPSRTASRTAADPSLLFISSMLLLEYVAHLPLARCAHVYCHCLPTCTPCCPLATPPCYPSPAWPQPLAHSIFAMIY